MVIRVGDRFKRGASVWEVLRGTDRPHRVIARLIASAERVELVEDLAGENGWRLQRRSGANLPVSPAVGVGAVWEAPEHAPGLGRVHVEIVGVAERVTLREVSRQIRTLYWAELVEPNGWTRTEAGSGDIVAGEEPTT